MQRQWYYMISIAEYFVMQKEYSRDIFDVDTHRSRIGFALYSYEMAKQIYCYDSDIEYVDDACQDESDAAGKASPMKGGRGKPKQNKDCGRMGKMKKVTMRNKKGNQNIIDLESEA